MTYYMIYMVIGISIVLSDMRNIKRIISKDDTEPSQAELIIATLVMVVGCILTWPVWFAYRVKRLFQRLTKKEEK